jgi:hypothetical protein
MPSYILKPGLCLAFRRIWLGIIRALLKKPKVDHPVDIALASHLKVLF